MSFVKPEVASAEERIPVMRALLRDLYVDPQKNEMVIQAVENNDGPAIDAVIADVEKRIELHRMQVAEKESKGKPSGMSKGLLAEMEQLKKLLAEPKLI